MGSKKHCKRDDSKLTLKRSRQETEIEKKTNKKSKAHRNCKMHRSQSSYSKKHQRPSHHKPSKNPHPLPSRRKYSSSSRSSSSSSASSCSSSTSHYPAKVGEYLGGKYKVLKLLGDGTFGRVVEVERNKKTYAVKIIKSELSHIYNARIQKNILKEVNKKDPEDKYGMVRYVGSFHHHINFCLVFKPLGKNLYEVMSNNNLKGFPLHMVRSFARQILRSVGFLHRIGYTHTDLKPENILLEKTKFKKEVYLEDGEESEIQLPEDDTVRIIDFGGATGEDDHHSKLISTRQYRAPQVILSCCQWTTSSDIWSIGCIIAELFTGHLYFRAHNDLDHLRMIEKHNEGSLPNWMVEGSKQLKKEFQKGRLHWPRADTEKDSIQRVVEMRTLDCIFQVNKNMFDLVSRCLQVDPRKRITCEEALKHSLFLEDN